MLDFKERKVIDIVSSRWKIKLSSYFFKIPKNERVKVKYVIIDMWGTYKELSLIYFNNAINAVDSFHVVEHLNKAMISIRINTMKKYDRHTNNPLSNDMYYYMLKKFHYFFTKDFDRIYSGPIDIPKMNHIKLGKYQILEYLLSINTDLREAYKLKEKYRDFNKTSSYEEAESELEYLINDFLSSKFDEFNEFGRLLDNWNKEIINSFIRVNNRRLSNGPREGINSRIKTMLKSANAYS